MSSDTRGPRPGKVPPHIQDRIDQKRRRNERLELLGPWYRRAPFVGAVAAVVGLVLGILLAQLTATDPLAEAGEAADGLLVSADQATLVWTFGLPDGTPPVEQGIEALRGGDATVVDAHLDAWLRSYDNGLAQLESTQVPTAADGPRQLLIAAGELSRDAVESLGAAATVEGEARDLLLDETLRLKARADEYEAEARRLIAELTGEEPSAVPTPGEAPALPRPSAEAVVPSGSPAGSESPSPEEPAASVEATEPEPTPTAS